MPKEWPQLQVVDAFLLPLRTKKEAAKLDSNDKQLPSETNCSAVGCKHTNQSKPPYSLLLLLLLLLLVLLLLVLLLLLLLLSPLLLLLLLVESGLHRKILQKEGSRQTNPKP